MLNKPPTILHIITGLSLGGAEMMLYKLLAEMPESEREKHQVLSLTGSGYFTNKIHSLGVKITHVNFRNITNAISNFKRIFKLIKDQNVTICQGWMYHGNLFASIVGLIFKNCSVFWNIRHSLDDASNEKLALRIVLLFSKYFINRTEYVIYNSNVAKVEHKRYGFTSSESQTLVIPNGFDFDKFKSYRQSPGKLKSSLFTDDRKLVIGTLARFHPMKQQTKFLNGILPLIEKNTALVLCMGGKDVDYDNIQLSSIVPKKLRNRVLLIGQVEDTVNFYNSLDIFVLPSAYGEGFPNVLGEAVACGVVCISTDVGDSKEIIMDKDRLVNPKEMNELVFLVDKYSSLSRHERDAIAEIDRKHVLNEYSIDIICKRYLELYR